MTINDLDLNNKIIKITVDNLIVTAEVLSSYVSENTSKMIFNIKNIEEIKKSKEVKNVGSN